MKNKYKDIEVIKVCDITEIPEIMINTFNDSNTSICFISDRESVEYTMLELFKQDDITADEIFLFDSTFPMLVGLDECGRLSVDDIEEEWYLGYNVVFIDMDSAVTEDIIDNCLNNGVAVFFIGEVDNACCNCCDKNEDNIKFIDEPIHGFNISFSDEDKSYEFKFYSSNEINKNDIMSILNDIRL